MTENQGNCSCRSSACRANRLIFYGLAIGVFILLLVTFIPKYLNGNVAVSGTQISGDIEKVEVYHFHATRQCYTCKTVGAFSEETVNAYFANELKSGKLVYAHVNVDLPENKALVDKYEAKGSSLLIGVYGKDGSFSKQEDTNVWYEIDNKIDFTNYLKGVIEQKFSGS
ncbi:hypothetical protein A3K73_08530 [Candidatus Pacearchaeota archaeon RBG_13_36_9]|nr:MAG: hypothetical protein A3K73_08530 [Candidatus Pacearchaeota archaeon RBG_13_36_9]